MGSESGNQIASRIESVNPQNESVIIIKESGNCYSVLIT